MNWLHPYQWVDITAPLTGGSAQRSPELLVRIVNQFQVETNARYRPTAKETFCNIFAADVTRALACPVPHWWNRSELTANVMARWLSKEEGKANGWSKASDAGEAIGFASRGFPVVAVWENREGGPGHIAIVLPSEKAAVEIAQAGRVNFARGPLEKGFGNKQVQFFLHN